MFFWFFRDVVILLGLYEASEDEECVNIHFDFCGEGYISQNLELRFFNFQRIVIMERLLILNEGLVSSVKINIPLNRRVLTAGDCFEVSAVNFRVITSSDLSGIKAII